MKKLKLAMLGLLALAAGQAMACYTVYDINNRVLYQGVEPPVDMSRPLHETLQRRYPGGSLVFEQGTRCGSLGVAQARPGTAPQGAMPYTVPDTAAMGAGPAPAARRRAAPPRLMVQASPLLTDRATAVAMHLPYKPLESGIVVVPPEAAAGAVRPSVTVVPGGAQPARAVPASISSVAPAPRTQTMITELHDPPMTFVQRGSDLYVSQQ